VPLARTGTTRAEELPSTNKALLFSLFGTRATGFDVATDEIAGYLKKASYPASSIEILSPTLDNLKDMKQAGIVYFNTHGGGVEVSTDALGNPLPNGQSEHLPVVMSSTPVLPEDEHNPVLQDWLKRGYIHPDTASLGYGPDGKDRSAKLYAITSRFINAYWSTLAPGGENCVYLEACNSGGPTMQLAFSGITRAFFGTIGFETSSDPARFLFDRLLGANTFRPVESPPQRPFDYAKVWADLKARKLDQFFDGILSTPVGTLMYYGKDTGLLAPSIATMDVDETQKTLTLTGDFGTDPGVPAGQVFVGGKERTSRTWDTNKIVVNDLPVSGDGAAGEVYVLVNQRKSNSVQLTEWNFHITYALVSSGSLRVDGGFDIHFRADVHSYRNKPAETPNDRVVSFQCARDTKGKLTATGSNKVNAGTTTWSGTADVLPPYDTTPQNVLLCLGTVDTRIKALNLAFFAESTNGLKQTRDGKDSLLAASTGFLDGPFSTDKPFPSLKLALDPVFSIPKGARSEPIDSSTTLQLSWDYTPATPPLDMNAARSATAR